MTTLAATSPSRAPLGPALLVTLWFSIAAVLIARSWNAFIHPLMWGEDATEIFLRYLDDRSPGAVLYFYKGYVSLLPSFVGWLTSWLPLTAQPHALSASSAAITALCFATFASRRFDWLVVDARHRAVLCIALAMLPFGNFAVDATVMWTLWPMLLALTMVGFARPPESVREAGKDLALLALCITANPISIVLLPVWLLRIWRPAVPEHDLARPGVARAYFVTLAAITVAYQLLWVEHGFRTGGVAALTLLADSARLFYERALIEPIIGLEGRLLLESDGWRWVIASVPLWVVIVAHRSLAPVHRLVVVALLLLGFAMTAGAVYARHYWFETMFVWNQRYTYVPRYCTYLAIVWCCFAVVRSRPRAASLLVVVFVLHALALADRNGCYYYTSAERGHELAAFVRQAEAWRADPHRVGRELVHVEIRRTLVVPAPPR